MASFINPVVVNFMKMGNVTTPFDLDDASTKPAFQVFEGPNYVDTMPALQADDRVALTISGLMKRRMDVLQSKNPQLIERAWNFYYDSVTGLAYKGNEVRVDDTSAILAGVTPRSKLVRGALPLTNEQWNNLADKPGFTSEEAQAAGLSEWLPQDEVIKHPAWKAVAGKVLQACAEVVFNKYNLTTGMAVYLPQSQKEPMLRPLALDYGDDDGSNLYGRDLDDYRARLVGVRKDIGLEEAVAQK